MSTPEFSCMQFRQEKLAEPHRLSEAARQHARACTSCTAFANRVDVAEARLAEALRVDVPEGLVERVLLKVDKAPANKPRRQLTLLALAATIVLATGIVLKLWYDQPRYDYARFAIEHVMHEPESFTQVLNADPVKLEAVLADFGAQARGSFGTLRYLRLCDIPGGKAWHIVIETEDGLATILLVPESMPGRKNVTASLGNLNAFARPAGKGYYAVVADSSQRVKAIDEMLDQHLRWQAQRDEIDRRTRS